MQRPDSARHRFDLGRKAWARLRARWGTQISLPIRMEMALSSRWFSGFSSLQRALFREHLDRVTVQAPLFILGHWRSGTSLLHELLCLDPRFAFASTQSCMHPHHALFAGTRPSGKAVRRPMDDMLVSASTPQEGEFALLCLGAPSPYEAFLFPQALAQWPERCDPERLEPRERADWERIFLDFLGMTTLLGGGRRLILKSPPHAMRIPTLLRHFPRAQFVHIVRHPADVYASSLDMLRRMTSLYAIGAPVSDAAIGDMLLRSIPGMEAAIAAGLRALPPQAHVCLTFESLLADPLRAIEDIYARLALGGFAEHRPRLAGELKKRGGHKSANRTLTAEEKNRLAAHCGAVLEKYGYALRP